MSRRVIAGVFRPSFGFLVGLGCVVWTGEAVAESGNRTAPNQCRAEPPTLLDAVSDYLFAEPPKKPVGRPAPARAPRKRPVVTVNVKPVSEEAPEVPVPDVEPVPGEEPGYSGSPVMPSEGAKVDPTADSGAVDPTADSGAVEDASAKAEAEGESEPEPEVAEEAVVAKAGLPVAPAPAPEEEATSTTVMGVVVLGLLPYTIAQGAFGIGSSVGFDDFSDGAMVSFGPSAYLGATDWLTFGASIPFASARVEEERATGLGNVGVTAQFAYFRDTDSGVQLSATPGVTLPAPSEAASSAVTPDLKASGAINFGAVAVNVTARGRVDVPTEGGDATPGLTSALSLILVNETLAPFVEGGFDLAAETLMPMGSAGVNWAPGGGALFTLGVPVVYDGERVKPGMAFTAYFETSLFAPDSDVATVATPFAVQ